MGAIIDSIICEASSWVLVKNEFSVFSMDDMMRDWATCISVPVYGKKEDHGVWTPREAGKVKINFDGASFGNPGMAGFWCVM